MVRLATCHRLELYIEGVQVETARRAFAEWSGVRDLPDAVTVRTGMEAARHLLRVTAGLESAVLGEDQILAQVRGAYSEACRDGLSGPLLHRLFHASFRAGKRVRAETDLARGGRSMAGAAVAALNRDLGGLRDKAVLVLGAGEIGSIAARRLRGRGVGRLLLSNRTATRSRDLARELDAVVHPWAWFSGALSDVDAVVCATGAPAPVLSASALENAAGRTGRPRIVVDLSVPANVERSARRRPPFRLIDVEDLSTRLREEAGLRNVATAAAERIVEDELREWREWARSRAERQEPRDRRTGRVAG